MRLAKDLNVDALETYAKSTIPVVDLTKTAPVAGSIALSSADLTPFYGNGTTWVAFGGAGALQSGGIFMNAFSSSVPTNGDFTQIPFDTETPLSPSHPSFTIDIGDGVIVINEDGNYSVNYQITPGNTQLSGGGTQAEKYTSRLQISNSQTILSECNLSGSVGFALGALIDPSSSGISRVTLEGEWSGFLPSGTSLEVALSIYGDNPDEVLWGEGSRLTYMGITKLA
jgi:hypothetical protein